MSVDLRLDYEIQIPFVSEECPYIDLRQRFDGNSQTRRVKISKDKPYLLPKGEFVLAYTLEAIKFPASIYAELHGKSRHARAGVSIHMTAPLIQPGSEGKIKLEIFSAMPVALYAEMPIAQLILYTLAVEPNNSYEGFYKQEGIDKSWFK